MLLLLLQLLSSGIAHLPWIYHPRRWIVIDCCNIVYSSLFTRLAVKQTTTMHLKKENNENLTILITNCYTIYCHRFNNADLID